MRQLNKVLRYNSKETITVMSRRTWAINSDLDCIRIDSMFEPRLAFKSQEDVEPRATTGLPEEAQVIETCDAIKHTANIVLELGTRILEIARFHDYSGGFGNETLRHVDAKGCAQMLLSSYEFGQFCALDQWLIGLH